MADDSGGAGEEYCDLSMTLDHLVPRQQPTVLFDEGEHALQQAIKLSMEEIPVDEDSREVPDADVPFREPSTGQCVLLIPSTRSY